MVQVVYPVLYAGGTIGGIWFIVRLMIHFQQDFTNRYAMQVNNQATEIEDIKAKSATETKELREQNDKLWVEVRTARRETEACERKRADQDIIIDGLRARLDRLEGTK